MRNFLVVKVNGQEVKNPALKIIIGILELFVVVIVIAAVIIPHFVLRAIGRQGFFMVDKRILVIGIYRESFKKIK